MVVCTEQLLTAIVTIMNGQQVTCASTLTCFSVGTQYDGGLDRINQHFSHKRVRLRSISTSLVICGE
jgi:hypothetical protein